MRKIMASVGLAAVLVSLHVFIAPKFGRVMAEPKEVKKSGEKSPAYTGTTSCRKCHEKFYKLWAPSHHGLAMQPYTGELAKQSLTPQAKDVVIGDFRYRTHIKGEDGWVRESGPDGDKKYRIVHALGGKNVYYFLTPMEKGRLQTLPVAYDVRKKEWFDMAKSGVRHFPSGSDEPVNWEEWPYTFNTACHSCHVSQLSTNYDLKTDVYHTTWREPGINCETCHGPAEEHIRVCESAPKGTVPNDLKIIRGGRDFTNEQNNDICSSCHAKAMSVTTSFMPGDRFFDHFDLVALENRDFYPDGRDLGENYTFTTWRMSPCAKAGNLTCLFCHTSSGRYRHKKNPNESCRKCHQQRVDKATEHTHHKTDSPGNKCIACHMPTTEFARMRRSDHSMLPPTPAVTIAYKSPNACNMCHKDETPQWVDKWVHKWRKKDYQAPILHRAGLIDAARKRDWSRLPDMLTYLESKDHDEIFTTSLIRLLRACDNPIKWPAMIKAMEDQSPLVRSAACVALETLPSLQAFQALAKATGDNYRLVRVRAAGSLSRITAGMARGGLNDEDFKKVQDATKELIASYTSRPDQWTSHYNLGNYYFSQQRPDLALAAFETALKFEPRSVATLVNTSMAYSHLNKYKEAEDYLVKALKVDPKSAEANFNMGLLKAERNELNKAEEYLRAALKADKTMHPAAYNLGIMLAKDKPKESLKLLYQAYKTTSTPKYGYTLAFFMERHGDLENSSKMLERMIEQWPSFGDAYLLLGDIYQRQGNKDKAVVLYQKAIASERLSFQHKQRAKVKLDELELHKK